MGASGIYFDYRGETSTVDGDSLGLLMFAPLTHSDLKLRMLHLGGSDLEPGRLMSTYFWIVRNMRPVTAQHSPST